jgi:hypothetical protein
MIFSSRTSGLHCFSPMVRGQWALHAGLRPRRYESLRSCSGVRSMCHPVRRGDAGSDVPSFRSKSIASTRRAPWQLHFAHCADPSGGRPCVGARRWLGCWQGYCTAVKKARCYLIQQTNIKQTITKQLIAFARNERTICSVVSRGELQCRKKSARQSHSPAPKSAQVNRSRPVHAPCPVLEIAETALPLNLRMGL